MPGRSGWIGGSWIRGKLPAQDWKGALAIALLRVWTSPGLVSTGAQARLPSEARLRAVRRASWVWQPSLGEGQLGWACGVL